MLEFASTLLEHMTEAVSKRGRGERKLLFYITAGVILFFKSLVLKFYNFLVRSPLFLISLFVIVVISLVIYRLTINERIDLSDRITCKIAFLLLSPWIGCVANRISNLLIPTPNMSGFLKVIEGTTRLGWVNVMFQWDNVTTSLYFIFYFVSFFYLAITFFRTIRDKYEYLDGLLHEFFLTDMTKYAIVMTFLVKTNIAYWVSVYLFSLLE